MLLNYSTQCCTCQPNEFNRFFFTPENKRNVGCCLDRKCDDNQISFNSSVSTSFSIIQHHSTGWPETCNMLNSTTLDAVEWNCWICCLRPSSVLSRKCSVNVTQLLWNSKAEIIQPLKSCGFLHFSSKSYV